MSFLSAYSFYELIFYGLLLILGFAIIILPLAFYMHLIDSTIRQASKEARKNPAQKIKPIRFLVLCALFILTISIIIYSKMTDSLGGVGLILYLISALLAIAFFFALLSLIVKIVVRHVVSRNNS
ncbi:hypothetical protein MsAg5_12820 [Methanosarcinaceae archaeon Ag5]|uniref:Uncharacterized protein n=1 Tax=Methanolapillus africanus TaxID=3028297 RepID=A0AAE4MK56_9EURY|nr:hypothetical protein [Methanosarcinaceae archaeon Ag5]